MLGPSSLSVSLPQNWVKRNNIKKGDEVCVSESENSLYIKSSELKENSRNYDFFITKKEFMILPDILSLLYFKGYSKIKLSFCEEIDKKEIFVLINKINVGYEIINELSNSIVIYPIFTSEYNELNDIIRRTFRTTIEYFKRTDGILREREPSDKSIHIYEYTIRKILNNSKRILYNSNNKQIFSIFNTIESLDSICHELSNTIVRYDNNKISGFSFDIFSEILNLLEKTYNLHYKFSIEEYVFLKKEHNKLKIHIKNILKNKQDSSIYSLITINDNIFKILKNSLNEENIISKK